MFGMLALGVYSMPASAQRLGGEAFGDPGIVWQSVPSDWARRPIKAEAQHADLAISLDQQLYPYLPPLIHDYAKKHGLTIATTKGTCGISVGLLFRKAIGIGGFCCPPAETDRLPGLRFHTSYLRVSTRNRHQLSIGTLRHDCAILSTMGRSAALLEYC
jgi:hypothetical protein